ncbi:MAG: hypothetical protein ACRDHL_01110 [Candidatus Promineifilaceae bacterium]
MRQREIFAFWLPLFASWLLMTAEGPTVSTVINRLPDEVVMLAAQGIVVGLSVTIESPIITLLATSTAVGRDRPSFELLRRFTIHWMILLTVVTAAVAFTPLFDLVVGRLLAVPGEVAVWVRPGLRIMTLWSAAIAWRRFLQGIMIRFNHTRKVAWGTAVRLAASAGTVIGLALLTDWPGVAVGATALMAGVIAEAAYATIAIRPILARLPAAASRQPWSYRRLFWFHLPLAGTSLLTLLAQPLVAYTLARLAFPTRSLAAWPVIFQFLLIVRAAGFALPEAVIALSDGMHTFRPLRRFTFLLALVSTLLMATIVMTPLRDVYIFVIQDMAPEVGQLAADGLALFLPLPALTLLIAWLRGLLIHQETTRAINAGMGVNLVVTALLLGLGLSQGWPGIRTAAIAFNLAALVEFFFLWWRAAAALDFPFTLFERPGRAWSA